MAIKKSANISIKNGQGESKSESTFLQLDHGTNSMLFYMNVDKFVDKFIDIKNA
jgi:hypothetical protein